MIILPEVGFWRESTSLLDIICYHVFPGNPVFPPANRFSGLHSTSWLMGPRNRLVENTNRVFLGGGGISIWKHTSPPPSTFWLMKNPGGGGIGNWKDTYFPPSGLFFSGSTLERGCLCPATRRSCGWAARKDLGGELGAATSIRPFRTTEMAVAQKEMPKMARWYTETKTEICVTPAVNFEPHPNQTP